MKSINSRPWLRSLHGPASHSEHSPLPALIVGSPQNIKHTKLFSILTPVSSAWLPFSFRPILLRLSSNAGTFWKTSLAVLNCVPFVPPEYSRLDSVISHAMHTGAKICLLPCLSHDPVSCVAAGTLTLDCQRPASTVPDTEEAVSKGRM